MLDGDKCYKENEVRGKKKGDRKLKAKSWGVAL